jgi:hypothetical protein
LGLKPEGGNHRVIQRRIAALGLDTQHLKGQGWSRGLSLNSGRLQRSLDEILVEGSHYKSWRLKSRLIRAGLKQSRREQCGVSEWNGLPVPLELDHLNGRHDDNRLGNLRILCANCHGQTPTFRGKNISRIGL